MIRDAAPVLCFAPRLFSLVTYPPLIRSPNSRLEQAETWGAAHETRDWYGVLNSDRLPIRHSAVTRLRSRYIASIIVHGLMNLISRLTELVRMLLKDKVMAASAVLHPRANHLVVASLIAYPLLCLLLRHRRLRRTALLYPYPTRASFRTMTDSDATAIQSTIAEYEFPFVFEKALQFALFRTYGIPSISGLLAQTTQLCNPATSCKRYSDTEILIAEFVAHPPTSPRSRQAISRMNYIHSGYLQAGKISNDDMLYTLSLFACEPVRWINRYEWRELEPFEVCAIGTFWKSIGDAMGISFEPMLRRSDETTGGGEAGWKDGLEWWEDVKRWSEAYEVEKMIPAQTNHETAEETTRILMWAVPRPVQKYARYVIYSLMDKRLRRAMM